MENMRMFWEKAVEVMPFECHWVYPVELLFDFHIASDKAGHPYTDDIKYCPVEYWFGETNLVLKENLWEGFHR